MVGTIYRAVTGDTIPEPIRQIGSMIVSGLMGGPVGVAIDVLTTAAEDITGIDPDRIGQALLHGESLRAAIAGPTTPTTPPAAPTRNGAPPTGPARPSPQRLTRNAATTEAGPPATPVAWTAAQLAAYGVRTNATGTLRMGTLHGADALNALELAHLHTAQAAYARSAALAR